MINEKLFQLQSDHDAEMLSCFSGAFVISRGLVSAHGMCCMHISNSIIDADHCMHALK